MHLYYKELQLKVRAVTIIEAGEATAFSKL